MEKGVEEVTPIALLLLCCLTIDRLAEAAISWLILRDTEQYRRALRESALLGGISIAISLLEKLNACLTQSGL